MKAMTYSATADAGSAHIGDQVRLQLPDGAVLAGTLAHIDARTYRLRPTGSRGLIVIYRQAAVLSVALESLAA
jgi:hypothetical protein